MKTILVRAGFVVAIGAPGICGAQAGGFVVRLGADTIAVERYERSSGKIDGSIVRRSPATNVLKYSVKLNGDGTVASYEQTIVQPDGSPLPTAPVPLTMTFAGDSVTRQVMQNGQATTVRSAAPKGTLPAMSWSWVGYELQLAAAKRGGQVNTFGTTAQQTAPTRLDVRFIGSDSAEVVNAGYRIGFKLDRAGRIARGDGSLTTAKYIATPVPAPDIAAITAAWAATDAAGHAMGVASTRDTVNATIGGAKVWIDYGRPAARGRQIWGALVPYDTTWRLGANAATQLRTDKDLDIGGVTVPAGFYTLFLYPTANQSYLVVNKQTGQWGTDYDASQDLVKIPLQKHMNLPTPEERFHIFVQGDMLMIHWDRGGYGVKVAAK